MVLETLAMYLYANKEGPQNKQQTNIPLSFSQLEKTTEGWNAFDLHIAGQNINVFPNIPSTKIQ